MYYINFYKIIFIEQNYKMRKSVFNISKRHIRRLAKQDADAIVDSLFESPPRDIPQSRSTAANNERLEECVQKLPDTEVDDRQEVVEVQQSIQEIEGEVEDEAKLDFQEEEREQEGIAVDDDQEMDSENDESAQDTTNESESDNDIFEEDDLKEFLSNWSVQYNISHVALQPLLRKLKRYPVHANLPSDPRSLLRTPRNTETRIVLPGEYCHVGLSKGVESIINRMSILPEGGIKISINIDGLPLSKSSPKQLWPILGSVKPYKNVFVIGIYYGEKKPTNVNDFLQDFVTEAKQLCSEGILVNGIRIQCAIDSLICDMPAKSFVLCTKGHSGYSSCPCCTVEGDFINRKMCFSQIHAPVRTDDDFRNKTDEEYHNRGITSCLVEIPGFGPVTNVPTDPMHLLDLGIMRRMLNLLLDDDLEYRIPHIEVERISSRLIDEVESYIPIDFVRKPRSLKFIKLWKATEFRQILLYTGPVVLRSLRRDIYNHFLTLHVAVRIMSDAKCHELLDYAQELVEHFILSFGLIYGTHNVSSNVHQVVHLISFVKKYGPIQHFSAYIYENHMQTFKRMMRKPNQPLQQIIRRCAETEKNTRILRPLVSMVPEFCPLIESVHADGPLIIGCTDPQYKVITSVTMKLCAGSRADSCCGLSNGAIVSLRNIAYCPRRQISVIIGNEFLKKENLFSVPCDSSNIGIFLVHELSDLKAWPLTSVIKKYVKLPVLNKFAVFPLLHTN